MSELPEDMLKEVDQLILENPNTAWKKHILGWDDKEKVEKALKEIER